MRLAITLALSHEPIYDRANAGDIVCDFPEVQSAFYDRNQLETSDGLISVRRRCVITDIVAQKNQKHVKSRTKFDFECEVLLFLEKRVAVSHRLTAY